MATKPAAKSSTKNTKVASKIPAKPATKKVVADPVEVSPEQSAAVTSEIAELLKKQQVTSGSVDTTEAHQDNSDASDRGAPNYVAPPVHSEVKDILMIARKECMSCSHLCPEVGKTPYTNCHYENGNEDCPAKTTVLMVGMSQSEIERAATAIVEATDNSDFKRLAKAAERLGTKSEAVRALVSKRVLEIQAEQRSAEAA